MEQAPIVDPGLQETLPVQVPVTPPPSKSKIIWGIVLIFFIIVASIAGYYFLIFKKGIKTVGGVPSSGQANFKTPKYWINCEDKRQVIEEGDLLYVGCLGGVLVLDKKTGEVRDQISVAEGMGDATANSIIKRGDILYIGTQDGVSVFNLKTREAKKIGVKEGLVNGANIELAADGDKIWVATFDGVSLLDPNKGTLTNYTSELDAEAEKRNVVNMLVTDKYVYFLEVASVYSSGAVIRFDKFGGTFKAFKPGDFGRTDQYARTDFNSISAFGNQVFVSDDKELFVIDENADASWRKIEPPRSFIIKDLTTDFSVVRLLKNTVSDGILVYSGSKIYKFNPDTETTETLFDFGKENPNILYKSTGNILWFSVFNKADKFINVLDLTSKQISSYQLKDRPEAFGQVLALIDEEPVLDTNAGIYKYSLEQGKFISILYNLSGFNGNFSMPLFQPIPGTTDVFIFRQVCGQGCEKPFSYIYNYADGTVKELSLPPPVVSSITSKGFGGGVFYNSLSPSWRDFKNGKIGFSYTDNGTDKYIVYDINTSGWSLATDIPTGADKFVTNGVSFCNRVYTYKTNGNKFGDDGCTGVVTNGNLGWKNVENKIVETDIASGNTKTLTPPVLEANYSPFDSVSDPVFGKLIFAHSKLWITSNRGLISYDPQTGSYKLYGPSDGLLSKDVADFLVGKNLWVVTNWGGLSAISE
ncbi:MAG: PQQ-binding-like beta-propeller repeat protein [Candidatus Woesebacteria bacterium]|nr:MAG: PQQ-binding-like beta-propeller repeat protein [Candidatus Woesebacteria bacterium]